MIKNRQVRALKKTLAYLVLILLGYIMIYPLLWLFFAGFKTDTEIFSAKLLPEIWNLQGYVNGWTSPNKATFGTYLINSFMIALPVCALTVISCSFVAYGFARFRFPGRNFLFSIVLGTMMLPAAITIIPKFLIYNELSLIDTYVPFYLEAALASSGFSIYLLVQFIRGIPMDFDQSAEIDGANRLQILFQIIWPLCIPAMVSVVLLQFVMSWNDFFNALIYIRTTTKYTIQLGLRVNLNSDVVYDYSRMLAMSFVSLVPPLLLFFFGQKYFVEGVVSSGVKG